LLDQYHGKWVVLYFYPREFTSGCTVEAHNCLTPITSSRSNTFLIDPTGKIRKVYIKVNPASHSEQLLGDLDAFQAAR